MFGTYKMRIYDEIKYIILNIYLHSFTHVINTYQYKMWKYDSSLFRGVYDIIVSDNSISLFTEDDQGNNRWKKYTLRKSMFFIDFLENKTQWYK